MLGVDVVVRQGLREYGASVYTGDPEGFEDVEARMRGVLQEVADEHRGEAVLVVSHAGAILAAVPPLVGLPPGWGPASGSAAAAWSSSRPTARSGRSSGGTPRRTEVRLS